MLRHLLQTDFPGPDRQFPDFALKPQNRLGSDAPFPALCSKAEAKKLTFPRSRHCALLFIDLEFEPTREEAGDTLLHPFPCPLAAHVDVAIVRVPHEAVVAPFQLSVKFVEHKIRQQWREHSPYTKGNFDRQSRKAVDCRLA